MASASTRPGVLNKKVSSSDQNLPAAPTEGDKPDDTTHGQPPGGTAEPTLPQGQGQIGQPPATPAPPPPVDPTTNLETREQQLGGLFPRVNQGVRPTIYRLVITPFEIKKILARFWRLLVISVTAHPNYAQLRERIGARLVFRYIAGQYVCFRRALMAHFLHLLLKYWPTQYQQQVPQAVQRHLNRYNETDVCSIENIIIASIGRVLCTQFPGLYDEQFAFHLADISENNEGLDMIILVVSTCGATTVLPVWRELCCIISVQTL